MGTYRINVQKVKAIMLERKMNEEDVLQLTDLSQSTWRRIINKNAETSFPNITAIAYALGVANNPMTLVAHDDHETEIIKKEDYDNITISKEIENRTIDEFRMLQYRKEVLQDKKDKQKSRYRDEVGEITYEDRMPLYPSPGNMQNDVVTRGTTREPVAIRATYHFTDEDMEILNLEIEISSLDEKLETAINKAVMCATNADLRIKLSEDLRVNLFQGVGPKRLNVEKKYKEEGKKGTGSDTFYEYRRIAIIEAAIALGYLELAKEE